MATFLRVRRYKGFEIHPIISADKHQDWQVRWHDAGNNACSLAPKYPSIASAKRAINSQIKHGCRPKRVARNRPIYLPFTSRRIG